MAAVWIWRQFPKQIARDLHRFHQLRIADWHRGARDADGHLILSSYELLNYVEYLDDEGEFKTAAERGGRWPDWKQMLAENVNESYRMRSTYAAVNSEGGDAAFDTSEIEFVDPVERERRAKADTAKAESDAKSQSAFETKLGYTR